MRRRIDLLDEHHTVTVLGEPGELLLQVTNGEPQPAELIAQAPHRYVIRLGNRQETVQMAIKGETAYIRAFDRTFTLRIVDPVNQAVQESGSAINTARAPMPGVVVEVHTTVGEQVTKGQPMMTIESMKILTMITAPRDGEVSTVHLEQSETFDKNAMLVSLKEEVA